MHIDSLSSDILYVDSLLTDILFDVNGLSNDTH